ncbi:hypothetical protein DVA80_21330, partial [Acinetobacter baumannii]|uniref:hypothetical protein n=1 Tax=Acinetobacter baumannii TaxID=470 RepID=UPI000E074CE3
SYDMMKNIINMLKISLKVRLKLLLMLIKNEKPNKMQKLRLMRKLNSKKQLKMLIEKKMKKN